MYAGSSPVRLTSSSDPAIKRRAASNINIIDHALAAADLGYKIILLRPLAKEPLHKGWQDEATSDPAEIMRLFAATPKANYGIPTGSTNDLYVVDIDGTEATNWWMAQGIETSPGRVATPSGPDRTHIYWRTHDVELPNTQGKNFPRALHPHIDTRGEGGYVVGPGSVLKTGTYRGDISHVSDLPEALLDMLPEKQEYTTEYREGEKVEAASDSERRQVESAIAALDELPRVWREGAGWRSEMFRVACWLGRMANTPDYAMTHESALAIILEHTPTDAEWGRAEIMVQWESAIKSVAGQYAQLPSATIPNLLPFLQVSNLLPDLTSNGDSFTALLFGTDNEGSDWKIRQRILAECFRAGLSPQQAYTVTWNARASSALQADMNGLSMLWVEVEKARVLAGAEIGVGVEAPAAEERPILPTKEWDRRIAILSDEERAFALSYNWFGSRYVEWAETRVSMMNAPYHRMNLWTILSLFFSDSGFIPKKKGPMGLNLFQMVLGKTTTGKTEAFEIMRSVIRACFPKGDSPDIGGDASPNSLIERLIERDGKPSWFNADEAHGLFKEMQGVTWRSGLREKWTMLYEGRVPIILRNGKRDLSGIDAVTHFVMYLMGTTAGMTEVLDEEFWTSGFLARYVFAIGEEMEPTPDSFVEDQQEGDVVRSYEAMPKQWAAEFATAKNSLKNHGVLPLPMLMTQQALDRHTVFKRQLGDMFNGHRQEALIKPTVIRFANSIRKCATLVAMAEGSPKVTIEHELVALEQAEEWLANIVMMANATTATGWTRSVDDVERFIASREGSRVRLEKVYARFPVKSRDVDEWIVQLIKTGRISKTQVAGTDAWILELKQEALAA